MVEDGAFSHKIDYVAIFLEILNFEGYQNLITGSRVTFILLNVLILPIDGASAVEGLQSTGLPRLVYRTCSFFSQSSYFCSDPSSLFLTIAELYFNQFLLNQ